MLFQVTHTTRYAYQTPVSHSLNEVRLTPRTLAVQHVRQTEIRVQPEPAFMHHRKDYYGNDVTSFELVERHDQLEVTADSIVDVQREIDGSQPSIRWEEARQRIAARSDAACMEASEFICNSPYVSCMPSHTRAVASPRPAAS